MSHRMIVPPEQFSFDARFVFLAGPIQGTWDWQAEAAAMLTPHIAVANPRRPKWGENDEYKDQVAWESKHLGAAWYRGGGILFWLAKPTHDIPGRAYAQTSRFELAEWYTHLRCRELRDRGPLVIGIEPGFSGERYIRTRIAQDMMYLQIHETLEDTCKAMLADLEEA